MEQRQKSYDMQAHLCSPRRCGHHSAGRRRCRRTQHTAGQGMAGWGLAAGPRQDCWKPRRTPRSAPSLRPAAAWAIRCCCKSNITINHRNTQLQYCIHIDDQPPQVNKSHSFFGYDYGISNIKQQTKSSTKNDVKNPSPIRSLRQHFLL